MSLPEDRATDPQPVLLGMIGAQPPAPPQVPKGGTFKHDGLDWQKSDVANPATNDPMCMCWSTGELRSIPFSTMVVESDLFFDER